MEVRHKRVRLETSRHQIEGTLQVPSKGYRARITDFLNSRDREFVALTDVAMSPLTGDGDSQQLEFLAVSVNHIVVVHEVALDPATHNGKAS